MAVIELDTIAQANEWLRTTTLHPLVSVGRLPEGGGDVLLRFGFYAVIFGGEESVEPSRGWKPCDYMDGVLMFLAPGQLLNVKGGRVADVLFFHPDLLDGTALGQHFEEYAFFHYRQDEALHVSAREKAVLAGCLGDIAAELRWGIDEYSRALITDKIGIFLNYGLRYYKRQFITRHDANELALDRLSGWVEHYFRSRQVLGNGLPSAARCARVFNMSAAYLNDLLRHETGHTTGEYLQRKRFDLAREQLRQTDKPVACIAAELGYPSLPYFCCFFRKVTGMSPVEYRLASGGVKKGGYAKLTTC